MLLTPSMPQLNVARTSGSSSVVLNWAPTESLLWCVLWIIQADSHLWSWIGHGSILLERPRHIWGVRARDCPRWCHVMKGGALWVCAIRQEEQQKGRQAPMYLWGFPWCVCPVFVCKQVFVCNLLISTWSKWVFITCGLLIQHHGYDRRKRGTGAPQWPQLHKQLLICDYFCFFTEIKLCIFLNKLP